MLRALGEIVVCSSAGALAYGVRGRTSRFFGESVHRGPRCKRSIALTFDDGPSESTPELLDLLAGYRVPATFFQCGASVRRLPEVALAVARAGHEIGNHTDTHAFLPFRGRASIKEELRRAQESIEQAAGLRPALFRAPYGARWFGLAGVQKELGLLGVMWTTTGRDWTLPTRDVLARLRAGLSNGAIFCLHDGRGVRVKPDIRSTLESARQFIPEALQRGFRFETVSRMFEAGSSG